jgi:MFS family permease
MKSGYRYYVLAIVALVYLFSSLDRYLLVVLAPDVKKSLGVSDAEIGLLFGTAFALLYGLFGIPLSKLADGWNRVWTISLGLAIWSGLTVLSGLAGNLAQLALPRIGIGISEASGSPAAVSILCDYFDKSKRATALSYYTVGSYFGRGGAIILGGAIVAAWASAFPVHTPFGLEGWRAAFIGLGVPGVVLALLVLFTVREPLRGALDGHPHPGSPRPFWSVLEEIGTMLPPWSLIGLYRRGGRADLGWNLIWLMAVVAATVLVTRFTGHLLPLAKRPLITTIFGAGITSNTVQWLALGAAVYASISWLQAIKLRDPVTHRLIVGSPTFLSLVGGCSFIGMISNGVLGFLFVYAARYLGFGPAQGFTVGLIAILAGVTGASLGGILGDRARAYHPAGRIYLAMATFLVFVAGTLLQLTTVHRLTFFAAYTIATLFGGVWLGCVTATAQDLVLPRMRGRSYAMLALGTNVVGFGLGPYTIGIISDVTGDLRFALLCALGLAPIAIIFLWYVARHLKDDESQLIIRARLAGEPI